jgi:3D (Asp-Asp-Asp) domain-containing protein
MLFTRKSFFFAAIAEDADDAIKRNIIDVHRFELTEDRTQTAPRKT